MGGNGGRFLCGKFEVTDGFECPACGNHVCRTCAKENGGLCPHCLGKLYRIRAKQNKKYGEERAKFCALLALLKFNLLYYR